MSDDDLTIAYQLGVEDMRSKLRERADEIERLRAENEILKSNLPARAVTRGLAEQHNEITRLRAENEKLREALKPFADAVTDEYSWKYDINSDDFRAAAAAIRGKE